MMTPKQFSPFAHIAETTTYPHSRTLRTSFLQKLWDLYHALAGDAPFGKPHLGLFDYLTLYSTTGLLLLMGWCFRNVEKNLLALVLVIPMIIINIPFLIARVVLCAVATILFLPIIAVVHGISSLIANQSHTKALSLEGELQKGGTQTLKEYLANKNMDIEELNIIVKLPKKTEDDTEDLQQNSYHLMFWKKATGPSSSLVCEGCLNGGCDDNHAPFSVKISTDTAIKQSNNIHALFKLNIGDVVTHIENSEINNADKQVILAI